MGQSTKNKANQLYVECGTKKRCAYVSSCRAFGKHDAKSAASSDSTLKPTRPASTQTCLLSPLKPALFKHTLFIRTITPT